MFPEVSFRPLIAALALLCLSSAAAGQSVGADERMEPVKIAEDFEISASLDHPAWDRAPSVFITHQVIPDDSAPAQVETEVKMLYTTDNLYIAFLASDPQPGLIRANVTDRDGAFQDDFVGVFFDTFDNNRNAYQFFVNPLGVQMDGMRTGNSEDMNFDALWYSEGAVTDEGYTAVIKIPFKSLSFPERDLQNWSVQFLRTWPRNNRYQFAWTDVDMNNSCLLCQSGQLDGMNGVASSRTVELLPYAMSFQNSRLADPGDPASGLDHGPVNARVGGSVSYDLNSTTSLNAVINPDFSQVETDAAQIDVNESFALSFEEKRPFFLRDADLFRLPGQRGETLFYSRMINNPLGAAKFTRKSDRYSIAFLTAYDRESPFVIPGRDRSAMIQTGQESLSNILRGRYSIGNESYAGGLITARNHTDGNNLVGNIDWRLQMANQYYFSGMAGMTHTSEPDNPGLFTDPRTFGDGPYDATFNGEQYQGTLLSGELSREAKHYNFSVGYTSYSPTFQTQNGFINQTDRRSISASQSLSYYPNTDWISQGRINMFGAWRYDFSGQFHERFIFTGIQNSFGGQTRVGLRYLPLNDERYQGRMFRNLRRVMIDLSSSPSDLFSFSANADFGRYINRSTPATVGKGYNLSGGITLKPNARMELSGSYNYSTLSSTDGTETYFSGDIFRLTSRYNFSRNLFARLITQYNSFSDQIQIYPLVSYKVNAFTKFYMGMTDNLRRFNSQNVPNQPGFDGYREINREFFVKFQYLIRS